MENQKNQRSADKTADKGGFEEKDSGRKSFGMSGERGRNRTYNLLIKSLFSADITACYCSVLAG
jgi:hypothetical protein